jgi:universal stress protein family protein
LTAVLAVVIVVLAVALAAIAWLHFGAGGRASSQAPAAGGGRILFPFVARALSHRALDAALRLARAEDATLVPVFLARVPLHLPLDAPLPRQSQIAIPLQEAIEHRATAFEVPVDARIERGRNQRHALRQMIDHERFDRIVIAAAVHTGPGFDADDVAWLLDNAPGEIIVLRPDPERSVEVPAARVRRRGHRRGAPVASVAE